MSGAAEQLVVDWLPADAWLTDLGTHQLRDFPRPERVAQLCHCDLRNEFPPLRTPKSIDNHNFPVQPTSFVGRGAQMDEVRSLLADNRLVTLTGAGGAGKTRLELASSLMPLWLSRGRIQEGIAWFDAVLVDGNAGLDESAPDVRARAYADKTVLDPWVNTYNMESRDRARTRRSGATGPRSHRVLQRRRLRRRGGPAILRRGDRPGPSAGGPVAVWLSFSASRPRPPWSPVTPSPCGRPPAGAGISWRRTCGPIRRRGGDRVRRGPPRNPRGPGGQRRQSPRSGPALRRGGRHPRAHGRGALPDLPSRLRGFGRRGSKLDGGEGI
jgi:hypothetical protein